MKKTFVVNDILWMILALLVCIGGIKLGFGTFSQPRPGFMPFLAGLLLGFLSLLDLIYGLKGPWESFRVEKSKIWAEISWTKLIFTVVVLFAYTIFFRTIGFFIGTIILLVLLLQLLERKSWWVAFSISVVTTILFYLTFKIGLACQLPEGVFGF